MTPVLLAFVLGAGLTASALGGPWLLRRAAPALARVPRLAIAVVCGGVVAWTGALLALGPVLAWTGSGPSLLPEGAAAVCRRCLDAANPFSGGAVDTAIPAALLLSLSAAVALVLGAGTAGQMARRGRRSREAARRLLRRAQRRELHGYDVSVVESDHPFALTFPARHGGIVLSTGAVRVLDEEELAAVLAHERAHLRQRHHSISAAVAGVAVFLRWVPLVAAAEEALPNYLEIAAYDRARRRAGTPALVGALLKLGEQAYPVPLGGVLHAAGPERIRQLVRPSGGLAGAFPAAAVTVYLLALAIAGAAVQLPYASAALTGCA